MIFDPKSEKPDHKIPTGISCLMVKKVKKEVDLPPSLSLIILFRVFMYSRAIVSILPAVFQTGGSEQIIEMYILYAV